MSGIERAVLRQFAAFEACDPAAFAAGCALPFVSVRDGATVVLADRAAVEAEFRRAFARLDAMGGIRLDRRIRAIRPRGATLVEVVMTQDCRVGGRALTDPITSLLVLRLVDDDWMLAAAVNPMTERIAALHLDSPAEGPT